MRRNPFPPGTPEHDAWEIGASEAQRYIEGLVAQAYHQGFQAGIDAALSAPTPTPIYAYTYAHTRAQRPPCQPSD